MTHATPRAELEPADTPTEPPPVVVGLCSWCNELVFSDEGHAYFPPGPPAAVVLRGLHRPPPRPRRWRLTPREEL